MVLEVCIKFNNYKIMSAQSALWPEAMTNGISGSFNPAPYPGVGKVTLHILDQYTTTT